MIEACWAPTAAAKVLQAELDETPWRREQQFQQQRMEVKTTQSPLSISNRRSNT
jgi:hypothetical protein